MPAGMSMVPGVATPMAAMWSSVRPAAATACANGLAHAFQAMFLALWASVGRLTAERLAGVIDHAGLHGGAADVQADVTG